MRCLTALSSSYKPIKLSEQRLKTLLVVFVNLLVFNTHSVAQSPFTGFEHLLSQPQHYVIYRTDSAIHIDGKLDEAVWQQAKWTSPFVDIIGSGQATPALQTQVKMLWDDQFLYIAAKLTDPHVWAKLSQHDARLFKENDFEVFIAPHNNTYNYYEIEVNVLNTVFDLFMNKPYRDGGIPNMAWDLPKTSSAVQVQGSLNNSTDQDEGWTVEIAIPFSALNQSTVTNKPHNGTLWRINFLRILWDSVIKDNQYVKATDAYGLALPEHHHVWSTQGIANMHYPERWGYLRFSNALVGGQPVKFKLPYSELQKRHLWLIYYKQKAWFKVHGSYATSLKAIDVRNTVSIGKQINLLKLKANPEHFKASIRAKGAKVVWHINEAGFIQSSTL